MDSPSGGGRDTRFGMGYNISLLSGDAPPEIYGRASGSIGGGLSRGGPNANPGGLVCRGLKRTSSEVCYEQDARQAMSLPAPDCPPDIVDDTFSPTPQKGSPPSNGKKTKGRVKIKMEYIDNKLRRYTTFSKRKTGIMKKAYELSTLTGTQVMLLVASETGHVYTFATRKLQPMITSEAGKALIQTCLNSPDPCPSGSGGDQRMSATGFEETELSYNIGDEDQKETIVGGGGPCSPGVSEAEAGSGADSTSSGSPPPRIHDAHHDQGGTTTSYPVMYPGHQGMVYASPSPGMPNGGVIFSVGGGEGGGPQYITIPLPPLGLSHPVAAAAAAAAAASQPPTDLSKPPPK